MDTLVTGSEEVEDTEMSDRIDVEDTNVDFLDKRINNQYCDSTEKCLKVSWYHYL
jgi:hypothetical protein